jgi:hypothetical protein
MLEWVFENTSFTSETRLISKKLEHQETVF